MMKKVLSALLAVIMSTGVIVTASACGGGSKMKEPGATVITMYAYQFEEYQTTWYEKIKNEFNDITNDGWELEVKYFEKKAYNSALQVARENGHAPDIFWCAYGNLNNLVVKDDHAIDIRGYLPEEYIDDIVDSVRAAVTYTLKDDDGNPVPGGIVGYPQYVEPSMMYFYRKSAYAKAGLTEDDVPKTWSEMLAVCEKIDKIKKKGQYTLGIPDSSALGWATPGLQVNTTGGYALDESWWYNRVDENDAGWRALAGLFWDINQHEYAPKAALTEVYDDILTAMCEGALLTTMGYAPGIAVAARTYPDEVDDIGVAIMPTWDESELGQEGPTAVNGGWNYIISKVSDEKHRQGAARVIEFFCCEDTARTAGLFEASAYSRSSPNKSVRAYISEHTNPEFAERQALVDYVSTRAIKPASYKADIMTQVGTMLAKMYQYNTGKAADKDAKITQAISEARVFIETQLSTDTYTGHPDYPEKPAEPVPYVVRLYN